MTATFGIAITADDKTAKGTKSAEKRLGQMSGRISKAGIKERADNDRMVGRSARGLLKTFGDVEKAGAKAFGGRSITSGITSRLSGITEAASAVGSGLGAASAAGGVLSTTLGVVGVAAGATIGVLAAAAYGAFKLASGWAAGGAAIGRMGEILGISTKALQEFTAAGERAGLDKSTAAGALGGLNQNLNDARYGRNNDVIALLSRLGLKLKTNQDGTVDTAGMLPEIADALKKQNSSGRRTAGRILGIPDAALPAFTQGGSALTADMKDADTHANVLSDDDIRRGRRIARKGTMVSQLAERGMGAAGSIAADAAEPGYDLILKGGRAIADGSAGFSRSVHDYFDPASRTIDRAANKMDRAADRIGNGGRGGGVSGLLGGVLRESGQDIINLQKLVATEWVPSAGVDQLKGIIDTVLNRQASGKWGKTIADVANARKQFSDVNGPIAWKQGRHSIDEISMSRVSERVRRETLNYLKQRAAGQRSIVGDNLNYANPAYSDRVNRPWIDALAGPKLGRGSATHNHGTTPGLQKYRPGEFGVQLPGGVPAPIPVHVTVDMHGAPKGTKTTVRAGSAAPAVSYAMAHGR
jgi:hypothetical protein